jgi:rRNA maturation RNase YbeY
LRKVRKDLAKALMLLGHTDAELSLLFVGSVRMKRLNTEYRGIPKETDVLSFPMEDGQQCAPHLPPTLVLGDIVISVPKAAAQAKYCGLPFHDELRRLLMHGLLHLLGYDHEKGRHRRLKMEGKERELLHAVQGMD